MQYRPFGKTGESVSVLGFGAMRFETENGIIKEKEAVSLLRAAIDGGVNYVDTAYFYLEGQSEALVGRALRDGYREKVHLATKSQVFALESAEDFDRILNEQLERLETRTIDFYLLHSLSLKTYEEKVLGYGLLDKMEKARADGKIRYIGFSFHDSHEAFLKILNGYDGWDFCQLQLNYIDVENQAGLRGLEEAAAKGLGVIVMEPLLGGKLANPAPGVRAVLPSSRTPVEWALDFLWDRPEVSLLLSGMNAIEQVSDNLAYAGRARPGMLTTEDRAMFRRAKTVYDTMALVPCTKCAYCMPCPFGVDIPGVFEAYNRTAVNMNEARDLYAGLEGHRADLCRACRRCERNCPQHIAISTTMKAIPPVFAKDGAGD